MQDKITTINCFIDNLMPPHNPFKKEFDSLWDSHRKLEKLIWEIQRDFHDFKVKLANSWSLSRVWSWIWKERNWTIPTLLSAICLIGGLAAYLTTLVLDRHLDSHIASFTQPITNKLTTVSDNTITMKAEIEGIKEDLRSMRAQATLNNLAEENPTKLAHSLHALRSAVQLPSTKVAVNSKTLLTISKNLSLVPESSEEYWPTVLQFIRFASSVMIPPSDVPPPGAPYSYIGRFHCGLGTKICMNLSHLAIILDGGEAPNSIFDHCRIKFTENSVRLEGSQFIDCVFEMPVLDNPNPYLKNAAQILLASNLTSVKIPKNFLRTQN